MMGNPRTFQGSLARSRPKFLPEVDLRRPKIWGEWPCHGLISFGVDHPAFTVGWWSAGFHRDLSLPGSLLSDVFATSCSSSSGHATLIGSALAFWLALLGKWHREPFNGISLRLGMHPASYTSSQPVWQWSGMLGFLLHTLDKGLWRRREEKQQVALRWTARWASIFQISVTKVWIELLGYIAIHKLLGHVYPVMLRNVRVFLLGAWLFHSGSCLVRAASCLPWPRGPNLFGDNSFCLNWGCIFFCWVEWATVPFTFTTTNLGGVPSLSVTDRWIVPQQTPCLQPSVVQVTSTWSPRAIQGCLYPALESSTGGKGKSSLVK